MLLQQIRNFKITPQKSNRMHFLGTCDTLGDAGGLAFFKILHLVYENILPKFPRLTDKISHYNT